MGNSTTSLPQQVVHPHCQEFPHTPVPGICRVATWSFCCAPLRNVWLHLLYSLPMGSWRYKLIILLFFRLNKPTFFCNSLFVICSSSQLVWWPFTRLIAVCWYLSCFTLPQTVHSSAQAASQMPEGDGVITYLDLLARLTDISQCITNFHCYKSNCSLKPALVVHWDLFCKAAVYPVSSWLLGLLYPRCRTLCLP